MTRTRTLCRLILSMSLILSGLAAMMVAVVVVIWLAAGKFAPAGQWPITTWLKMAFFFVYPVVALRLGKRLYREPNLRPLEELPIRYFGPLMLTILALTVYVSGQAIFSASTNGVFTSFGRTYVYADRPGAYVWNLSHLGLVFLVSGLLTTGLIYSGIKRLSEGKPFFDPAMGQRFREDLAKRRAEKD